VRIEIGCGSDPAEMNGAWPAYRKLSHGRSCGGAGNRVRERVLDSRAKPAGVGNDHRRRKSGNASCDQLKERPPVGDPRKLYRFSSRGCQLIHFTVARRRGWTAGETASSVQFNELHGDVVAGGASRGPNAASKTNAKSKSWMLWGWRKSAPQSLGERPEAATPGGSEVRWNGRRKPAGNPR
jgi:hypothetical protein